MQVFVEPVQPLSRRELRQLGSLTERFGMRLTVEHEAEPGGEVTVVIDVPRARAGAEACEVVESLLEHVGATAEIVAVPTMPSWARALN